MALHSVRAALVGSLAAVLATLARADGGAADVPQPTPPEATASAAPGGPAGPRAGQVLFQGKWQSVEEVAALVSHDPRWQQYRELKEAADGTPASHEELAQWCQRNGLENEERYHWSCVLLADPSHSIARGRLKVRDYRGGLYTEPQIAEYERQAADAKANFDRYKTVFAEVCRRITRSSLAERHKALDELRQVSDPAAIGALEHAAAQAERRLPDELVKELYLAVVGALANMPQHAATLRLLDYSVFATIPEVRQQAAAALRPRPVTDYVPYLMAGLTAPIEAEIDTLISPDGMVIYGENLYQAGPEADLSVVRSRDYIPVVELNGRQDLQQTREQMDRAVAANARRAALLAHEARQRVAMANLQAHARNERIREVLKNSLDLDLGGDPKVYWQAWAEYNELSYDDHPTYTYTDNEVYLTPLTTHSCFMAGTPVWTQAGPTPIERVAVGDLVLSQHPDTGELAYRPVLETTIGPPTPTVEINLPGETITATRGHRLWMHGSGWQMAKQVEAGASLYGLSGPLDVASVEAGDELECHNMVVADFHTFFVGQSRILAHDKTCPRPTTVGTPGVEKAPPVHKKETGGGR